MKATLTQCARGLIGAGVDPLVTISPDGKITYVNEATAKVTGAARGKLTEAHSASYFSERVRTVPQFTGV